MVTRARSSYRTCEKSSESDMYIRKKKKKCVWELVRCCVAIFKKVADATTKATGRGRTELQVERTSGILQHSLYITFSIAKFLFFCNSSYHLSRGTRNKKFVSAHLKILQLYDWM